MQGSDENPAARATMLERRYSDPGASAIWWLCDRHDPRAVAYTLVAPDLSTVNITYGELRSESIRLAASLAALGVCAGDRVATLMGKRREYLVTLLAIWRLGAVHVPLFTAFAPPAVSFRLRASGCKTLFCDSTQRAKLDAIENLANECPRLITTGLAESRALTYADLLSSAHAELAPVAPDANTPIIQIYTSGTTGTPKGVVVPLRALASFQMYAEYGLDLRPDDVFWNAADPGWAYGLYFGVIASLLTGTRSVLLEGGFSAATTLSVLAQLGVTHFAAAPTVFRSLRASGLPVGDIRVRCASSAGEPLTGDINDWARAVLKVPIRDHYGQTETGMLINNHHHPSVTRPLKPGSMGHAMPGWRAVILKPDEDKPASAGEQGRVALDLTHSPLAWFAGYVDDSAHSAQKFSRCGRWYFTGDSGRMDEEGYYYFAARDDDVIIMAGYRIGPAEVESVLAHHPAVAECAVVASPDEVRGETLEAVVVLNPSHTPSEALSEALQRWVKERYAAHAYPRRVHYFDQLPKTPSGKIQRFILRDRLREERSKACL
jgi:acetyl-CoA synthetase